MASQRGLRFGVQILFTYGPLGFLHSPTLYFGRTALLAESFVLCLEATLLFLVARNFVRAFGLLLGGFLFSVVSSLATYALIGGFLPEMGTIAVALIAVDWVQAARPGKEPSFVDFAGPAGLGAFCGMLLLVKFDAGALGLGALGAACFLRELSDARHPVSLLPALRRVSATLGSALGGTLVSVATLWWLAGQRFGDLPAFVRGSLQIAQGYASAMNIEDVARRWEYPAAAAVAIGLIGLALWAGIRHSRAWRSVALPASFVVVIAGFFKEGFVRHDGHSLIFFAGLLIMLSALVRWIPRSVGVLAVVLLTPAAVHGGAARPSTLVEGPQRVFETLQGILDPARRSALQSTARAVLRKTYGIPPADLAMLKGHTVHIDPWEATVAWAYPELKWDPVPVFQTYSAYAASLDRINAVFLASAEAPEFILRADESIDGRDAQWESPDYVLDMMCRYRQVDQSGGWQVLQRIPFRCGTPMPLALIPGTVGTEVHLPPPPAAAIETVRVAWPRSLGDALRELLYKDAEYYDTYAGHWNRFLPGTAGSQHVLAAPSCLEWSPEFVPASGPTLKIVKGFRPVPSSKPISFSVDAVPFRCSG